MFRLDALGSDLRHALRSLRASPGFTAVAVLMLALGIGINAIVFTIANAVLFKGFQQVPANDRLLYITAFRSGGASYPDFEDWRAEAASFRGMAIVHGVQQSYSDDTGFPETFTATEVSSGTFALVGQHPILGRDFATSDEAPGASPVAMLRYGFWERRYGRDPKVIGRVVRINGRPTQIVGVMPEGFSFPQNQDFWVPLMVTRDVRRRDNHNNWFVVGRLKDGVPIETARAEMATIGKRLEGRYPDTNRGFPVIAQTFDEFFIGPNATIIYEAMMAAVAVVLLVACANLANLLLARAMRRSREATIRVALGAGRWQIIRPLLLESLLLSTFAGGIGFAFATIGVRAFALTASGSSLSDQIAGDWFDQIVNYSMDGRVLAFVLVLTVATAVLFGLVPAARLARLDVNAALKDGGRGIPDGHRGRQLSRVLVVAEMALAVVLLAGAGVMVRSFLKIYTADLGFNAEPLVTASFALPASSYATPDAQRSFYDRLADRLAQIPGVDAVAVGALPSGGSAALKYELPDGPVLSPAERQTLSASTIGPRYFRTLGVAVLAGREFEPRDATGPAVAVVNRRFAVRHWPERDAVGQRLRVFGAAGDAIDLTVVGVVADVAQNDPVRADLNAIVYLSYQQRPRGSLWAIAHTGLALRDYAAAFRREVRALDPALATQLGPFRLAERLAWRYQYRQLSGTLFLLCALSALVLAAVGLYAVVAYSVNQRTAEIGVRMAIGASARDIVRLVVAQGLAPMSIGLVVGLVSSQGVNRALRGQLVQVSPSDPLTLVAAAGALSLAAFIACWIPARRAAAVDPMVALRRE
jgi:putative ABC transport system permease protein